MPSIKNSEFWSFQLSVPQRASVEIKHTQETETEVASASPQTWLQRAVSACTFLTTRPPIPSSPAPRQWLLPANQCPSPVTRCPLVTRKPHARKPAASLHRWGPHVCSPLMPPAAPLPSPASVALLGEKEMATPSSILAWRVPWTEEPGRPQSMGSQRGGRSRSDLACVILTRNSKTQSFADWKFLGFF